MEAIRYIEIGEEIYWCYGSKYWSRWKPRLPLPRATGGNGGAGGPGAGQKGATRAGGQARWAAEGDPMGKGREQ